MNLESRKAGSPPARRLTRRELWWLHVRVWWLQLKVLWLELGLYYWCRRQWRLLPTRLTLVRLVVDRECLKARLLLWRILRGS